MPLAKSKGTCCSLAAPTPSHQQIPCPPERSSCFATQSSCAVGEPHLSLQRNRRRQEFSRRCLYPVPESKHMFLSSTSHAGTIPILVFIRERIRSGHRTASLRLPVTRRLLPRRSLRRRESQPLSRQDRSHASAQRSARRAPRRRLRIRLHPRRSHPDQQSCSPRCDANSSLTPRRPPLPRAPHRRRSRHRPRRSPPRSP